MVLLTVLAICNARFELFEIQNVIGSILTGVSIFFLPGHILAILMTYSADPPHLWGIIIGYSIQSILIIILIKKVTKNN